MGVEVSRENIYWILRWVHNIIVSDENQSQNKLFISGNVSLKNPKTFTHSIELREEEIFRMKQFPLTYICFNMIKMTLIHSIDS